jgi:transposase-like protein
VPGTGWAIGRHRQVAEVKQHVRELASGGMGRGKIAREHRIGVSAVERVLRPA